MPEISPTKAITRSQIIAIKTAQRRHGIEDMEYRQILDAQFQASSCKDLTRRQASELLTMFGRDLRNPPGKQDKKRRRRTVQPAPDGVTAMATPDQRRLIGELVEEIGWMDEAAYTRWLWKSMRIRKVATRAQAARVIEGLKAMRRRQG